MAKVIKAPSPSPETARKQDVEIVHVELDGRWSGWWFDADISLTLAQFRAVGSEKLDETIRVLSEVISDWNYVDKRGEPLPPASASGFDDVGLPLLRATVLAYIGAVGNGSEPEKN